jgi:hypothetical protein
MNTLFFKLKLDEKIKINHKKNVNIILKKDLFDKFELNLQKLKDSKLLDNKFVSKIYKLDELELDSTIYIFKVFEINSCKIRYCFIL